MDAFGPQFTFSGEPVGIFLHGISPASDGLYTYMPYRSAGHLHMVNQLGQAGSARCAYEQSGHTVSFNVTASPEYGQLWLEAFVITPQ